MPETVAMNVNPVPTLDERINDIRLRTADIVNTWILPNEAALWAYRRAAEPDEVGPQAVPRVAGGDQERGQEGGAVGAAPSRRVRRDGARFHGATPT